MNTSSPRQGVTVSVPGKIMLAGEYSVLTKGRSLSATVDAFLTMDISDRIEDSIEVQSNLWPQPIQLNFNKNPEPLFDSLQSAAKQHDISRALVQVRSHLSVAYGLGSSSAVRLAAHLGLLAFAKQSIQFPPDLLWSSAREAWRLQREQQGFASGYDLVTQLHGGYLEWRPDYECWPGAIRSLSLDWLHDWVHPYAGGQGAPTEKVGGSVRGWLDQEGLWPELLQRNECLIDAFLAQEGEALIAANQTHRQLFQKAPFYPASLYKGLASLSGFDRSWSFKTTGAGGEDAILILGHRSNLTGVDAALNRQGWKRLSSSWTTQPSQVKWKDSLHD